MCMFFFSLRWHDLTGGETKIYSQAALTAEQKGVNNKYSGGWQKKKIFLDPPKRLITMRGARTDTVFGDWREARGCQHCDNYNP